MLKSYSTCFLLSFFIISFCHGQSYVGESASAFLTSKPPKVPTLISPSNSSENIQSPCKIVWNSQIHTSSYSLHVSEDTGFSELTVNQTILSDTSFLLTELSRTTNYYWRVKATNVAGESSFSPEMVFTTGKETGIEDIKSVSYSCWLQSPYPNPFSTSITIAFYLAKQTKLTITIYNHMGQAIRELISETKEPGEYAASWNGSDNQGIILPSGLYFCVLSTENNVLMQTFLFIE